MHQDLLWMLESGPPGNLHTRSEVIFCCTQQDGAMSGLTALLDAHVIPGPLRSFSVGLNYLQTVFLDGIAIESEVTHDKGAEKSGELNWFPPRMERP